MKLPALLDIPFWAGIFWRRANPISAWVSFIAALITFLVTEFDLFIGINISLPWQMIAYLSAGLIGAIAGALLTKPQSKECLDRFYDELNTLVDAEEQLASDNT